MDAWMQWEAEGLTGNLEHVAIYLIPMVGFVSLFTALAVVGATRERRKERESLHRHETARRLIEAGRMDAAELERFLREEKLEPRYRRLAAMELGGGLLAGLGLALFPILHEIEDDLMPMATLPLFLGGVLTLYAASAKHEARKREKERGEPPR